MTLYGIIAVTLRCYAECVSYKAGYIELVEDRPTLRATKV